jgi:hypothetical protein
MNEAIQMNMELIAILRKRLYGKFTGLPDWYKEFIINDTKKTIRCCMLEINELINLKK